MNRDAKQRMQGKGNKRNKSGTVKQDEETHFYILYAYLKCMYTNTCILKNMQEEVECCIQSQVTS